MEDLLTIYRPDEFDKISRGIWLYFMEREPTPRTQSDNTVDWFPSNIPEFTFGLDLSYILHQATRSKSKDMWIAFLIPKPHANLTECRIHGSTMIRSPLSTCLEDLELVKELPTYKIKLDSNAFRLIADYDIYHYRQAMKMAKNGFCALSSREQIKFMFGFKDNSWAASACVIAMMNTVDPDYHIYYEENNGYHICVAKSTKHQYILFANESTNNKVDNPLLVFEKLATVVVFPERYNKLYEQKGVEINDTKWFIDNSRVNDQTAHLRNGKIIYKIIVKEDHTDSVEEPEFLSWLKNANISE